MPLLFLVYPDLTYLGLHVTAQYLYYIPRPFHRRNGRARVAVHGGNSASFITQSTRREIIEIITYLQDKKRTSQAHLSLNRQRARCFPGTMY